MLYHFLYEFLYQRFGKTMPQLRILNVFGYITFRTAIASLTALTISLMLGPWLIARLQEFQIGQHIREEGPKSHQKKAGTPTMGGVLIVVSILVPTLLWTDLRNRYMWLAVISTLAYGAIGFSRRLPEDPASPESRPHGRNKMGLQIVVSLAVGIVPALPDAAQSVFHQTDSAVLQVIYAGSDHRQVHADALLPSRHSCRFWFLCHWSLSDLPTPSILPMAWMDSPSAVR